MDAIIIKNIGDEIIIKLNKKYFDHDYLLAFIKRLTLESLAKKSDFSDEVLNIGEQIKLEWWLNNKENFLRIEK